MKLYRLVQKKYSGSPFNPLGSKLFGGRWNSKGIEALYFAESESLCILEVFVHVNSDPHFIELYDLFRIDMPHDLIAMLDPSSLPEGWDAIPPSEHTQEIGDEFLLAPNPQFIALQVPSVISPRDSNYLVNPNHPSFLDIKKNAEKLAFKFDRRIFK